MCFGIYSRALFSLIAIPQADGFEKRRTSVVQTDKPNQRYGRNSAAIENDASGDNGTNRQHAEEQRRRDEALVNSEKDQIIDDARLVDPRLADTSKEEEFRKEIQVAKLVESTAADTDNGKASAQSASASMTEANLLVVIISNRRDGMIPTLASIITTASRPVDVVVIGEHGINEQVRTHFGSRINEFISMSVQDITDDLIAQGMQPIWTWPEWHTSMDPSWKNENTLQMHC